MLNKASNRTRYHLCLRKTFIGWKSERVQLVLLCSLKNAVNTFLWVFSCLVIKHEQQFKQKQWWLHTTSQRKHMLGPILCGWYYEKGTWLVGDTWQMAKLERQQVKKSRKQSRTFIGVFTEQFSAVKHAVSLCPTCRCPIRCQSVLYEHMNSIHMMKMSPCSWSKVVDTAILDTLNHLPFL